MFPPSPENNSRDNDEMLIVPEDDLSTDCKKKVLSCFWCFTQESVELCSQCGLVASCDKHWKQHRDDDGTCFPIRVDQHPHLGRRLVATRDIKRGEILLTDRPSAMGPLHQTRPVCLECMAYLPSPSFGCPHCGFPLCGQDCVGGPNHAKECRALKMKGTKVKITRGDVPAIEYQSVMLIRLLLGDPAEVARVDLLSDHVDKLTPEEREVYGAGVVKVVQALKIGNWTQEQLFRYISIIRTNACAFDGGPGQGGLRILHPSLATMNHNCLVNTRICQRLDHSVCVRAVRDIKVGEEVTNRYTTVFMGRLARRQALSSSWQFDCNCLRCQQPTVHDGNTDTLVCPACSGYMVQKGVDGDWHCDGCEATRRSSEVAEAELRLGEAIASRAGNLKAFEVLLEQQTKMLHTDHHLMLVIKREVIEEYGKLMAQQASAGKSWSLKQVRRKVELCREVLAALEKIDPGLSCTRGNILEELGAPQLVLLQHGLGSRKMERTEVMKGLEELIDMLKEVKEHLELFEECQEPGRVARSRQLLTDTKAFQDHVLALPA